MHVNINVELLGLGSLTTTGKLSIKYNVIGHVYSLLSPFQTIFGIMVQFLIYLSWINGARENCVNYDLESQSFHIEFSLRDKSLNR